MKKYTDLPTLGSLYKYRGETYRICGFSLNNKVKGGELIEEVLVNLSFEGTTDCITYWGMAFNEFGNRPTLEQFKESFVIEGGE